jgi:hypothetical protein
VNAAVLYGDHHKNAIITGQDNNKILPQMMFSTKQKTKKNRG